MNSPSRFRMVSIPLLFVLLSVIMMTMGSCGRKQTAVSQCVDSVLKKELQITVFGRNGDAVVRDVCRNIHRIELQLGAEGSLSQISGINNLAGNGGIRVNDTLYSLIGKSIGFARISNGLYDPTASPLYDFWNRYWPYDRTPSRDEVYDLLSIVNYRLIDVQPQEKEVSLRKPGMELDLDEIVDGFFIDVCADSVKKYDFLGAELKLGNTVRYIWRGNEQPDYPEWVPELVDEDQDTVLTLENCENRALAFQYPQSRLILNPLDGYPVETDLLAVVVIGPDAVTADALAYIFAVGDMEYGMQLIEDMPFFEAVCATGNGEIYFSHGARKYIKSHAPGFTLAQYVP